MPDWTLQPVEPVIENDFDIAGRSKVFVLVALCGRIRVLS